jgi:hypothetical protein
MLLYLFKKVKFQVFVSLIWHYQAFGIIMFYMFYDQIGVYFESDKTDFQMIFRPYYNYIVPFIMGVDLLLPEEVITSRIYSLVFDHYIMLVLFLFLISFLIKLPNCLIKSKSAVMKFLTKSNSVIKHNYLIGFIMIPHYTWRIIHTEEDYEIHSVALA